MDELESSLGRVDAGLAPGRRLDHLGRFRSGTVTLKKGHALIRTGPDALARHPIYTGLRPW